MKHLRLLALLVLSGCSTVNCTVVGTNNRVVIEQPKTVTTSPAFTTGDNTVPVVP